jgi:DNA-directed RNA polymerase specialized sigma subunit
MTASLPDRGLVGCLKAPPGDSPDYPLACEEQRRILRWCLHHLHGRHARVVALRYENGMTFRQIGSVFGMSEPAAFALHGRILDRIRDLLAEHGIHSLRDIL